ncbi:MAG: PAS domain S-box protein [Balneolales bacterium]
MNDSDMELLKSVCKDQAAFEKARALFDQYISEKNTVKQNLDLLEAAICNDYDSIVITEMDLENPRIVYVNDGFIKLTGYTKEEAIGKTPKILQGPKTERKVLDDLKSFLKEGKSFFGQAINYKKDGSEFVNQWDIHPLVNNNGEITHWVSYQHDITERKKLEGEKAGRFLFAGHADDNLYERSAETIVDFLDSGAITFANHSFCELAGYCQEELKMLNIHDLIPSNKNKLFDIGFKHLWENGIQSKSFRALLKHKSSLPVQVEINLRPVESRGGKGIRAFVGNISLRKKVFKTLKKRNTDYRRLVNKRSDFTYGLSLDANGNPFFKWVSEGFKSITGFKPEECSTAGSWQDLVHPEDIDQVTNHINKVLKGKSSCSEYRIKTCQGGFKKVLDYAKVDDTNTKTVKGSIVDITLTKI